MHSPELGLRLVSEGFPERLSSLPAVLLFRSPTLHFGVNDCRYAEDDNSSYQYPKQHGAVVVNHEKYEHNEEYRYQPGAVEYN